MSNLLRFLLALLTPIVLLGQKYEVHLSPGNRVGDVFLYAGKGTKFEQVSTAGQIMKHEEISAEFEGRVEVLDVDASGEPVRLALTVSKFTKLEDGRTSEVLKPGSIVVVDGGAENPVALKDGQISDDARTAFAVVYTPHKPGSPTDDDILGSKEPRAFGESWPINSKLAVEDAKKSGIEIPPEQLKGRTELVGKDRVGEADCLNVHAEFAASGVRMKDLPTIEGATIQATLDGCVPIAGTSIRKGAELTIKARLTSNASTFDVIFKQESSEIWKQLGK